MIGRTVSHYTIQSLIGSGAMGDVYKAFDTRLERPAAIKFMTAGSVTTAAGTRRFLQEARAASALDHANICTIYESGETDDGLLYLAMAFYEGETLAAKLSRGRLPVDQAASLSRQVALGLSCAHQYGIVHRDIKPANLFVTRFGELKILDFGLAKLHDEEPGNDVGMLVGTVPYMSPEHASGAPVDHRADIWSLGVVLYELLTGQRPFRGGSPAAILAAILYEEPAPLASLRPDAPAPIVAVVEEALRKSPDARLHSCQLMARVLGGESWGLPSATTDHALVERLRRSVMVMPFDSLDDNPETEYFGHGLADEVTTALSRVETLRVLARTAAERAKASGRDLRAVARHMGVEFVVSGAIRRQASTLRVSANLIEARTGALQWSEQFTGVVEDIFVIQEQLSQKIANALRVHLAPARPQKSEAPLVDFQAYDYYLRAKREFVRYEPGGLQRASAFIDSAIARVGENPRLIAAQGQIFWQLVNSGSTPDRGYLARAEACAARLNTIDPSGPHGPRLLGMVRLLEGRIRETITLLESAVARDPYDTDALSLLGPCYGYVGLPQAGWPLVARLLELDPLTPMYQSLPGYLYLMAGSFENAVEPFARSIAMDPGNPLVALSYGQALAINDHAAEAIDVFDDLQARSPDGFMSRIGQLYKCGLLGRPSEAARWTTPELETIADWDLFHAWNLAECFALLGDRDRAVHWLGRSIERGMLNYPLLAALDPFFAGLHGDAGFQALMAAVRPQWDELITVADTGQVHVGGR